MHFYIRDNIKIEFKKIKSVNNPNSIHGIYPYRGKISAVDAIQIITQLPKKGKLLDPFCGSGTIIYEAKKHGLDVIGIDNNPIAIQIAKAKFLNFDINSSIKNIRKIINSPENNIKDMPIKAKRYFHPKTAMEIMHLLEHYESFNDYEKAAFLGTICLASRGCNHYIWSSTQIGKISNNKRYINFYDKFLTKLKKHYYPVKVNNSKIILNDTRILSKLIKKESIDFVYTSPPYFDALDYTSNYTRIIHYIFENDVKKIKDKLIQNFDNYSKDIEVCLNEIVKVTKKDGLIIFIVGDKKKKDIIINGGEFFSKILENKPNFIIERTYNGTASKIWDSINRTERKEQIVIWDKSTWKK